MALRSLLPPALRRLPTLAATAGPQQQQPTSLWSWTSTRGYLSCFWKDSGRKKGIEPTFWPKTGHFSYGQRLQVKIAHPRVSEVHRYRRAAYDARIKTYAGRRMIMDKILAGRKTLAENRRH